MKRTIVKVVDLHIVEIQRSKRMADELFIITAEKGTQVHPSLVRNNQDPTRSQGQEGGSFIIGEQLIKTEAHSNDIHPSLYLDFIKAHSGDTSNSKVRIVVEERVVGEPLFEEDGSPVLDKNGMQVVCSGTNLKEEDGTKYYIASVRGITLSADAEQRISAAKERRINTVAAQLELAKEKEGISSQLILPRRRAVANIVVTGGQGSAGSQTDNTGRPKDRPVQLKGETVAKYNQRLKEWESELAENTPINQEQG